MSYEERRKTTEASLTKLVGEQVSKKLLDDTERETARLVQLVASAVDTAMNERRSALEDDLMDHPAHLRDTLVDIIMSAMIQAFCASQLASIGETMVYCHVHASDYAKEALSYYEKALQGIARRAVAQSVDNHLKQKLEEATAAGSIPTC